jgi:ABC transporter substrate binding protein
VRTRIGRRDFMTLLGGAAVAWPIVAQAQQDEHVRRIGLLMGTGGADPLNPPRLAALAQGLQESGWTIGRNLRIDYRWGEGNADIIRKYAAELVALAPDVILANGSSAVAALQQITRTVAIVFTSIVDPVSAGFVYNLARPCGNATGFTLFEYSTSGKWLELLKRSRRASREPQSCGMSLSLPAADSWAQSSQPPHGWGWNCAQSACGTPARSSRASPISRADRMAV